jgi:hypothetical protein
MSSEIRTLFPEMGPLVGYAVTCVIRAEPQPLEGHRAVTYGWWDYVLSIPAPRVIVVHDLDEPRARAPSGARCRPTSTRRSAARRHHRRLGAGSRRGAGPRLSVPPRRTFSVSHAYVHMVDFGLPIKVGGLWIKPGEIVHADQHGAVTIPADIAGKIPRPSRRSRPTSARSSRSASRPRSRPTI